MISLKRGEFKLSIGGLNNNIPYTVQKLSTIWQSAWSWQTRDFNMALNAEARATEQMTIWQSAWSWQTRDFNMALNAEARATEQMTISLLIYMNYEPKLKEKDKRG